MSVERSEQLELEQRTYNLTRKLYSDARRLIDHAEADSMNSYALVPKEDLERLKDTLTKLKNAKKE